MNDVLQFCGAELLSYGLGYLNEISRKLVEGAACFFVFFSCWLQHNEWEGKRLTRREQNARMLSDHHNSSGKKQADKMTQLQTCANFLYKERMTPRAESRAQKAEKSHRGLSRGLET